MTEDMTDETGIEVIDVSSDKIVAMDPITRAEIDIAITTAKRYPRELKRFADNVTSMATLDQETAEGCFYSLRRQGKTIQGPSVRLAEIAVSAWGNIRAGARILGDTDDGKFIRAMGVCHDLERNVYIAIESQRRITDKNGRRYSDDMVGVTANAAAAIGFRNAALKVIPRALLKKAYNECLKVATGGAKTLRERREQVFERLKNLNPTITEERILSSLGRPSIEEVTLDDVTHLIGLGTAIKDGAQTIDEAFPEVSAVKAEDILNGKRSKLEELAEEGEKLMAQREQPKPKEEAPPVKKSGGETLSPSRVEAVKKAAKDAGVDLSSLEEEYGGPIAETFLKGRNEKELEAGIMATVKKLAEQASGQKRIE